MFFFFDGGKLCYHKSYSGFLPNEEVGLYESWTVGVVCGESWGGVWRLVVISAWGQCPIASAFLAVVTKDGVYVLDLAAKVDATADYICKVKWGDIEFPPPFGREAYPEVSCFGEEMESVGGGGRVTNLR